MFGSLVPVKWTKATFVGSSTPVFSRLPEENLSISIKSAWYYTAKFSFRHGKFSCNLRACSLLVHTSMEYYCNHCDRYRNGDAYRVTSDEFGLVRLDIIVCYECYLDARRLGLRANKMVAPNAVTGSVLATGVDCLSQFTDKAPHRNYLLLASAETTSMRPRQ